MCLSVIVVVQGILPNRNSQGDDFCMDADSTSHSNDELYGVKL